MWNEAEQWIEMRLRSLAPPAGARRPISISMSEFESGEDLLTEISAKFDPPGLERELLAADFVVDATWGATEGEFLLALAHPYC